MILKVKTALDKHIIDASFTRRHFLRSILVSAIATASTGLIAGCGGGGDKSDSTSTFASSTKLARATIKVVWPARHLGQFSPKLIPVASNSIKIDISNGATSLTSKTVSRPTDGTDTSIVNFDPLPVGDLTVTATAYPDAEASGTAQATGTGSLTTILGQTTTASVTMASTIAQISIAPASPSVSVGQFLTLVASCMDSMGAIVLVNPSTLQFASSDSTLATVDNAGKVTGVAVGSPNITVTETESGKIGSVSLEVSAPAVAVGLVGTWSGNYSYSAFGNGSTTCSGGSGTVTLVFQQDNSIPGDNISGTIVFDGVDQASGKSFHGSQGGANFSVSLDTPEVGTDIHRVISGSFDGDSLTAQTSIDCVDGSGNVVATAPVSITATRMTSTGHIAISDIQGRSKINPKPHLFLVSHVVQAGTTRDCKNHGKIRAIVQKRAAPSSGRGRFLVSAVSLS